LKNLIHSLVYFLFQANIFVGIQVIYKIVQGLIIYNLRILFI
jgi:hypothetical protein